MIPNAIHTHELKINGIRNDESAMFLLNTELMQSDNQNILRRRMLKFGRIIDLAKILDGMMYYERKHCPEHEWSLIRFAKLNHTQPKVINDPTLST